MSIRLRLTLLYSAILAITLIAFSTALYTIQTHVTYDSIKANLKRQALAFASPRQGFPGSGEQRPPGEMPPPGEQQPLDGSLSEGILPGRWTQIRSYDGAVTARTYDLGDASLPLSANGLRAVQNGTGWFETAQVEDQAILIYSQSFQIQDSAVEIVQMAFPIAEREQSLRTLRTILVVGCGFVILVAFAVGWVMAGAVLHPIHRITLTAHAIGAERDFGRRVLHAGPTDEVGQLALTFNEMLAELESAYRQLEQTLESQHRFVADASHELRTPLTTISGNIGLLRRKPPIDAQERADVLADTADEVERLIRLVHQLLALARTDAGQPLLCEPLPIKPLLEDICRQSKLLASQQAGSQPELGCQLDPALTDVLVLGNRDALKQVLLILLDNALVHTSNGATIEMTATPADGDVVISVRDSGAGIAPDVLPHIFERFYRGQVSRSGTGTGLGLSIAKELVEAQGGAISVESQLGQGSVFTLTLPQSLP
ncbi:MAG: HAMP domain-containing histidine kinase [Thermoflexales bacterium]|nr:HAMP domain-containing histidine kinase [Thermoflexales bacterium]